MTKAEMNARLPVPLSASALKKITIADLQARVDALPPAQVLDDSEYLTPTKKRNLADGIIFAPADEQKNPRAGSKRETIIDLLRAPQGTTIEAIANATGWSRDVAQSAIFGDVKALGYGVERKGKRLFLLVKG